MAARARVGVAPVCVALAGWLLACNADVATTEVATTELATTELATTSTTPANAAPANTAPSAVAEHDHASCGGAACGSPAETPPATVVEGGTLYGRALDPAVEVTELSVLLAAPAAHVGKVVRTAGTITRACQHRGCWLELSVDGTTESIRVPMAGHGFFIPPESTGQRATVEGTVSLSEAAGSPRPRIDATSVLIASRVE